MHLQAAYSYNKKVEKSIYMPSVIFVEFDFLDINNQTLNVSLTLIMNMFPMATGKHTTAAIKCKCFESRQYSSVV